MAITAEQIQTKMKSLRWGCEVEVSQISMRKLHSIARVAYMGAEARKEYHATRDSSVNNGGELVSGIMNYEDIETHQEMVRHAKQAGGDADFSTGIHVHIDGKDFIREPSKLVNLLKLVKNYEDHIYHALEVSNYRERKYAWRVKQEIIDKFEEISKDENKKNKLKYYREAWYRLNGTRGTGRYDRSRYHAINIHALFTKGTIEFRLFNGTLHAGKVKTYIQLSLAIVSRALLSKRVGNKKRPFNSDKAKYEVRCLTIKLGLIGPEFKTARLLLTRHLAGNSAWHRA